MLDGALRRQTRAGTLPELVTVCGVIESAPMRCWRSRRDEEKKERPPLDDWVERCRKADRAAEHERGIERGVPTDVDR